MSTEAAAPSRAELAEIFLRTLLGACPNLEREGRLCPLCLEMVDALDYAVVYVGGPTAVVTPRQRGD